MNDSIYRPTEDELKEMGFKADKEKSLKPAITAIQPGLCRKR